MNYDNKYWIDLIAKRKAEINAQPNTDYRNIFRVTLGTAILSALLLAGAVKHAHSVKLNSVNLKRELRTPETSKS